MYVRHRYIVISKVYNKIHTNQMVKDQIKSDLFAISAVHNITIFMNSHCVWLDRQAITSHLCLPIKNPPPQPNKGHGASLAPTAGSVAEPRPKWNFIKCDCRRSHLVARISLSFLPARPWKYRHGVPTVRKRLDTSCPPRTGPCGPRS